MPYLVLNACESALEIFSTVNRTKMKKVCGEMIPKWTFFVNFSERYF